MESLRTQKDGTYIFVYIDSLPFWRPKILFSDVDQKDSFRPSIYAEMAKIQNLYNYFVGVVSKLFLNLRILMGFTLQVGKRKQLLLSNKEWEGVKDKDATVHNRSNDKLVFLWEIYTVQSYILLSSMKSIGLTGFNSV